MNQEAYDAENTSFKENQNESNDGNPSQSMTNNISGSSFNNSKINLNMGDVQNNTVVNSRPLFSNRHIHNHVTVVKQTAAKPSYTKAKPTKQAPKTSNHAKGYKRSSSSKSFTHAGRASSTAVSKPQSFKGAAAPWKKCKGSSSKGSYKFSTSKAKGSWSSGVKNRRTTSSLTKYR